MIYTQCSSWKCPTSNPLFTDLPSWCTCNGHVSNKTTFLSSIQWMAKNEVMLVAFYEPIQPSGSKTAESKGTWHHEKCYHQLAYVFPSEQFLMQHFQPETSTPTDPVYTTASSATDFLSEAFSNQVVNTFTTEKELLRQSKAKERPDPILVLLRCNNSKNNQETDPLEFGDSCNLAYGKIPSSTEPGNITITLSRRLVVMRIQDSPTARIRISGEILPSKLGRCSSAIRSKCIRYMQQPNKSLEHTT